ncbi:MAG: adenosylcobinamide-GDP ribazoletransferase [Spirochaetaceae bacterium]|jgi:adenosylcobinamide-GDP ribazoletransferase|nr:adenosylcobinamide-GDP ribazoletransferase [Spirochaetaceae bacterium]
MFDRFLSVLSLVCRIPIRLRFRFDPSRADFYLPITGLIPALLGFLVFAGSSLLTESPFIWALLILLVQYFCFNLFHLDGLADTADAFLGSFSQEQRFAILKDSRIGVYGLFAAFAALSLKAALLARLSPLVFLFPAGILAYPLTGRFSAALIPCMAQPANPGGLGALIKDSRPSRCLGGVLAGLLLWTGLVLGLIRAAALFTPSRFSFPFAAGPLPAILLTLPLGLAALNALFFARLYRRSLGGYTGDALGSAVETGELLHLLTALVVFKVWGFSV